MKPKLTLPFLETMLTQVCNLSCEGCTNYSDLTHSGYVTWSQGREWLEKWLERFDILDFGIMGGEPLINPEFREWLCGVRKLMPNSQIRFTTNGLLLGKHWDIIDLMHDLGNVSFKITVHVNDPQLNNLIQRVYDQYEWKPVTEYGIDRHITTNNFRFHVRRPTHFVKTFRNTYHDMAPWHSVPSEAFAQCIQQTCPLLYQGRIYKCSTSALLKDVLNRFNRPNYEQWEPYLENGITPDSTQEELQAFIDNFQQPHAQCGQCPSSPKAQILHDTTVRFK